MRFWIGKETIVFVGPRTLLSHFFQVPNTVGIYKHPSRPISISKKWPLSHVWPYIEWSRCRRVFSFTSGNRYDLSGYSQDKVWEKNWLEKFFKPFNVSQVVLKISLYERSYSTVSLKWVSIAIDRHVDMFTIIAIDLSVVRPFCLLWRTTCVSKII